MTEKIDPRSGDVWCTKSGDEFIEWYVHKVIGECTTLIQAGGVSTLKRFAFRQTLIDWLKSNNGELVYRSEYEKVKCLQPDHRWPSKG